MNIESQCSLPINSNRNLDYPVTIYCLSDPRDGGVRYVGKTYKPLRVRLKQHISERGNNHKNNWIKELRSIGLLPLAEPLEDITSDSDLTWEEAEAFWVETLRFYGCPLTNLETGGLRGKRHAKETGEKIASKLRGIKRSEETKKRLAESVRNMTAETRKKIALAASNISEETRSKMRAAAIARCNKEGGRDWMFRGKLSPEHRAAISDGMKGHKGRILTPEARQRIAKALRGRKLSPERIAKRTATLKRNIAARKYGQQFGLFV